MIGSDNAGNTGEAGDSEQRYRRLLDQLSDGIFIATPDGYHIEVNDRACEMTGYSREELIGRHLTELLPETERVSPPTDRIRHGASVITDRRLLCKDGSIIDVEVSAKQFPDGSLQAICRDISDRKHLQAQLIQAERLASIGTLATGMAHEINNPLTYMMCSLDGLDRITATMKRTLAELRDAASSASLDASLAQRAAETLDETLAEPLPQLVHFIQAASEGAERIRDIVRDLKTFSRVGPIESGPVDVEATLDLALTMANHELRHRATVVRCYEQVPCVHGQAGHYSQVFLNLIVNAAHAVEAHPGRDHELRITTHHDGDAVEIRFSDTGVGITEADLMRVFDPFFTTKPIGLGTGLGLPVCRNILESYGGSIEMESEHGMGTTCTLRLPVSADLPSGRGPEPTQSERSCQPPRRRILLVDDEEQLVKTVAQLLSRVHDVEIARSGTEAQQLLSTGTGYDLVLSDVLMPNGSGPELFRWLEEERPELVSRTVFTTGAVASPEIRQFLTDSGRPHLIKPFGLTEVETAIERVLAAREDCARDTDG